MSSDVKVIHLDGEDFSVESDSDTGSVSSSRSSKGGAEAVAATAATKESDSSSESSSGSSGSDSDSECNTTDLLAADPLYFILSRLFMTPEGKNIATILEDINTKLDALLKK
jgi:hypothetical protein